MVRIPANILVLGAIAGITLVMGATEASAADRAARAGARTSVNRPTAARPATADTARARTGNVAGTRDVGRNVNANHSRDINRNVNVDRDLNVNHNHNVNIDVDHHGHGGWDNDWDDDWDDHPFATAAAVTAGVALTSAVIGSIVYTVPPSCITTIVNGIAYQQCGSTWYQPQYSGTTVQYIVVNPPH